MRRPGDIMHCACRLTRSTLWLTLFVFLQHAVPFALLPMVVSDTAAAPAGLAADQLLTFANQLLGEGEYFRAITEYRRFMFTYPDDPRKPMAHFRMGQAFYRGQSYDEALRTFGEVVQQYPDTPYGKQAWLWQGESLMQQTQYAAAEQVYTRFIKRFPTGRAASYAQYQHSWTLLYRRQWHDASVALQRIPSATPLYAAAQQLATEAQAGDSLPKKSPVLAGILSGLLPGSGQLYNGRLGDAVLAFLLNGLFIAGSIEAIEHGEHAIAGVLSFFEAGWYTGNVYGAVNGAHKHNRHETEVLLHQLERRFRVPPPNNVLSQHMGLRLGVNFSW